MLSAHRREEFSVVF